MTILSIVAGLLVLGLLGALAWSLTSHVDPDTTEVPDWELYEWNKRYPSLPPIETYDPVGIPVPQTPTSLNPRTPLPEPNIQPRRTSCSTASMHLPDLKDESLRSIRVKSSDGERYYTVDLLNYTCTCPSFLKIQSTAPMRDVGRLCKHICRSLSRRSILKLLSPICHAMVTEGHGIYPGRSGRDRRGNPIYITGVNSQGWLSVFALKRKDGKTYFRFGYNVTERRWSHGIKPNIDEGTL
jgi:hypothetical protein